MNIYLIAWTGADKELSTSIILEKNKLAAMKNFTQKCKTAYNNGVNDMFNIQIQNLIDLGEGNEKDINELLANETEELMDYYQFWEI